MSLLSSLCFELHFSTIQLYFFSIDDILADSDSDLPEDMDEDESPAHDKTKSKKQRNTFIREDPEDIVDLADIKSIGNVLSTLENYLISLIVFYIMLSVLSFLASRSSVAEEKSGSKTKTRDVNRGFKTADDGRLIISDKALRGIGDNDSSSSDDDDNEDDEMDGSKAVKRGMEEDSSDGKLFFLIFILIANKFL